MYCFNGNYFPRKRSMHKWAFNSSYNSRVTLHLVSMIQAISISCWETFQMFECATIWLEMELFTV
jgi:hypothetical protein